MLQAPPGHHNKQLFHWGRTVHPTGSSRWHYPPQLEPIHVSRPRTTHRLFGDRPVARHLELLLNVIFGPHHLAAGSTHLPPSCPWWYCQLKHHIYLQDQSQWQRHQYLASPPGPSQGSDQPILLEGLFLTIGWLDQDSYLIDTRPKLAPAPPAPPASFQDLL